MRRSTSWLPERDVDTTASRSSATISAGTYASVLFGSDARLSALVMMAPTARWGDWFLKYWTIGDPPPTTSPRCRPWIGDLAPPGRRPADPPAFADNDRYVRADVAQEIRDAAGASAKTKTHDTGHQLDAAARADRDTWLAKRLSLD